MHAVNWTTYTHHAVKNGSKWTIPSCALCRMQLVATQDGDWDPFAASCVMEVGGVLRVLPCEEATQATSTFALAPAPIKLRPNSATSSCLGLPGSTLSAVAGQPLQQLACANSQTQALVPVPVLTSESWRWGAGEGSGALVARRVVGPKGPGRSEICGALCGCSGRLRLEAVGWPDGLVLVGRGGAVQMRAVAGVGGR